MRYVTGIDEKGQPIEVKDPMAQRLLDVARKIGPSADALAAEFLAIREVFGDLGSDGRFRAAVTGKLAAIYTDGALAAAAATA